jgi:Putative auto-transporter adhesin, head GIN domain
MKILPFRSSLSRIVFAVISVLLVSTNAIALEWSWTGKSVSATGVNKTETRNVTGFSGVELSLPAKVTIKQGTTEGVTIETDEAFFPYIAVVVERDVLRIRSNERNINFKGRYAINITVNAINIDALSVSGSGDIFAEQLKSPKLKASIAGSGDIAVKSLSSDIVKASISGSGTFVAGGTANELEASIAGSGDVKTDKLKTRAAKVSVAGSGNVYVWSTDTLKISIAGSGDIRYYGDAKVSQSVAGSGSVKRLGDQPS